jgi:uncharacterized membrane protein (DUF485 family)
MTEPHESAGAGGGDQDNIDWIAAERSPEFKELVSTRNRFVVPCTIFFLTWYLGFILLSAQATDFMGKEFLTDGVTVGYALALTQFIMVWALAWAYIRKAERDFDPLARAAAAKAVEAGKAARTTGGEGDAR